MKHVSQIIRTVAACALPLAVAVAACWGCRPHRRAPMATASSAASIISRTLTSTVPDNGDQNPYAIVVAPVSAGKMQKGDVLVTNSTTATTCGPRQHDRRLHSVDARRLTLFATIPRHLPQCPGGVGLTTAMTMLK